MNTVERIKNLCKERKISIAKLEKDLHYGNGYIGQLRKSSIRGDRLVEIANYFGVTIDFLLGDDDTPYAQEELNPMFLRLKQGLEPYNISKDDVDFLLDVYKAHIKQNAPEEAT